MNDRVLIKLHRSRIDNYSTIAHITLNRPHKLNSWDLQMFKDVRKTALSINKDRSIRGVVISAAGSDFSTVKLRPGRPNLAQSASTVWRRLPVPVIAAIHGRCWGVGFQCALGADFRIASPSASLSLREARLGLVPDCGGIQPLTEIVPRSIAADLVFSGREVGAEEALRLRLVDALSPDPVEAALEYAERLARDISPDAIAGAKRLLRTAYAHSEPSVLASETLTQSKLLTFSPNIMIARKLAKGQETKWKPRMNLPL